MDSIAVFKVHCNRRNIYDCGVENDFVRGKFIEILVLCQPSRAYLKAVKDSGLIHLDMDTPLPVSAN